MAQEKTFRMLLLSETIGAVAEVLMGERFAEWLQPHKGPNAPLRDDNAAASTGICRCVRAGSLRMRMRGEFACAPLREEDERRDGEQNAPNHFWVRRSPAAEH